MLENLKQHRGPLGTYCGKFFFNSSKPFRRYGFPPCTQLFESRTVYFLIDRAGGTARSAQRRNWNIKLRFRPWVWRWILGCGLRRCLPCPRMRLRSALATGPSMESPSGAHSFRVTSITFSRESFPPRPWNGWLCRNSRFPQYSTRQKPRLLLAR